MALQRSWVVVWLVATLLVTPAVAQKNEVVGVAGRTFVDGQRVPNTNFFDNQVNFGEGFTIEGVYGRHLSGGDFATLMVEVPVVLDPQEELNYGINTIPKNYWSLFVTPGIRGTIFAGNRVSPWASFGGGFGHFSESSDLVFGGANPGKTGTTTGVYQYGFGVDVKMWKSYLFRCELRNFNSGVPQLNVDTGKTRQNNIFVGVGFGWRF